MASLKHRLTCGLLAALAITGLTACGETTHSAGQLSNASSTSSKSTTARTDASKTSNTNDNTSSSTSASGTKPAQHGSESASHNPASDNGNHATGSNAKQAGKQPVTTDTITQQLTTALNALTDPQSQATVNKYFYAYGSQLPNLFGLRAVAPLTVRNVQIQQQNPVKFSADIITPDNVNRATVTAYYVQINNVLQPAFKVVNSSLSRAGRRVINKWAHDTAQTAFGGE